VKRYKGGESHTPALVLIAEMNMGIDDLSKLQPKGDELTVLRWMTVREIIDETKALPGLRKLVVDIAQKCDVPDAKQFAAGRDSCVQQFPSKWFEPGGLDEAYNFTNQIVYAFTSSGDPFPVKFFIKKHQPISTVMAPLDTVGTVDVSASDSDQTRLMEVHTPSDRPSVKRGLFGNVKVRVDPVSIALLKVRNSMCIDFPVNFSLSTFTASPGVQKKLKKILLPNTRDSERIWNNVHEMSDLSVLWRSTIGTDTYIKSNLTGVQPDNLNSSLSGGVMSAVPGTTSQYGMSYYNDRSSSPGFTFDWVRFLGKLDGATGVAPHESMLDTLLKDGSFRKYIDNLSDGRTTYLSPLDVEMGYITICHEGMNIVSPQYKILTAAETRDYVGSGDTTCTDLTSSHVNIEWNNISADNCSMNLGFANLGMAGRTKVLGWGMRVGVVSYNRGGMSDYLVAKTKDVNVAGDPYYYPMYSRRALLSARFCFVKPGDVIFVPGRRHKLGADFYFSTTNTIVSRIARKVGMMSASQIMQKYQALYQGVDVSGHMRAAIWLTDEQFFAYLASILLNIIPPDDYKYTLNSNIQWAGQPTGLWHEVEDYERAIAIVQRQLGVRTRTRLKIASEILRGVKENLPELRKLYMKVNDALPLAERLDAVIKLFRGAIY